MEYIGVISYVVYHNDDNKYSVIKVKTDEGETISMTGYMSYLNKNEKYSFKGDYGYHYKYGKQFNIESYEVIRNSDEEGIINYLSSSLFKGIGEKQATLIVEALGNDCINLIIDNKHVLDNIKGMTVKKRDTIYEVLTAQEYDNQVLTFFLSHGLSTNNLSLIQSYYKENTLEVLQNNPYQLIEDIDGIGFKSADDIAIKLGFDLLDPLRLKAGIAYCLYDRCYQSGSTYQYLDEIYLSFRRNINDISEELFNSLLEELIDDYQIIYIKDRYYPVTLYESEEYTYNYINVWLSKDKQNYLELDTKIDDIEKSLSLKYDDTQREAIKEFINNPIMILTGGPGTGKTTIIDGLLRIYRQLHPDYQIALCAPTGRASKRLGQLSESEAYTIHRLLKWDLNSNTFMVNEDNPLNYDLLVIDEFSMVDTLLFASLLKACRNIKKILIVGDDQQLPSVSPGNLLKELLEIEKIPKIRLNHIYRQSLDSGIIQLAHQIRNNNYDFNVFNEYEDIHFYNSTNIDLIDNITIVVSKAIEAGYNQNDIQVLAPMYKGIAGIDAINERLQTVFNPKSKEKKELKVGYRIFREGDKVLQLKNRVDDNVFNGDIGIIEEIIYKDNFNYSEDVIVVNYDHILVEYTRSQFDTITHAYCISIHKAQGNEFKIVIMAILNDYYIMLKKNLIYTGITRAKQSLFVLGDPLALIKALNNNTDNERKTSLKERFYS